MTKKLALMLRLFLFARGKNNTAKQQGKRPFIKSEKSLDIILKMFYNTLLEFVFSGRIFASFFKKQI